MTHLSQKLADLWVTQHGRLRKIPSDMSLCKRHFLCLKVQRNPSDLFAIALQPFFS